MAVSLQFPVSSSIKTIAPSPTSVQPKAAPVSRRLFYFPSKTTPFLKFSGNLNKNRFFPVKAIDQNKESVEEPETAKEVEADASASEESKLSEIGAEIKKAMKEREGNGNNLAGGVAEEIREIEWPAFGKVLGTTGVVLGVIAGSSVVLLTVNAVLAELSDRVFAGKGIQDFFS
ncbi:preprotein translocase subunit SECE1-like [Durio zibethinus]|uniref:Preprotein translocase subunit SECE1-like n=1 Tax=Durio zibethinus TaxID=66656 RepID=A0A6P6AB99_DURZI|nr:preprotein translocase subunit SECE1-like [Durio zibethinus]